MIYKNITILIISLTSIHATNAYRIVPYSRESLRKAPLWERIVDFGKKYFPPMFDFTRDIKYMGAADNIVSLQSGLRTMGTATILDMGRDYAKNKEYLLLEKISKAFMIGTLLWNMALPLAQGFVIWYSQESAKKHNKSLVSSLTLGDTLSSFTQRVQLVGPWGKIHQPVTYQEFLKCLKYNMVEGIYTEWEVASKILPRAIFSTQLNLPQSRAYFTTLDDILTTHRTTHCSDSIKVCVAYSLRRFIQNTYDRACLASVPFVAIPKCHRAIGALLNMLHQFERRHNIDSWVVQRDLRRDRAILQARFKLEASQIVAWNILYNVAQVQLLATLLLAHLSQDGGS